MYTFIRFFCFCYCCFSIHYFDTAWHLTSQPINFTLDSLFSRWNQVLIKYGDVLQILFFSHLKLSNQWQEELSISTNLMVCSNWLEFFDEAINLFLDSKRNLIANVKLDKICEIYFLIDGALSQVHNQHSTLRLQSKMKTISFMAIAEVFFRMVLRLQNIPRNTKNKIKRNHE